MAKTVKVTAAKKKAIKASKGSLTSRAIRSLSNVGKRGTPSLRKSITPGTVLIVLTGAHKGKRVVFLKQLPSGLLVVTGPFQINGVPVRRVNQAYVIATSTKVKLNESVAAAVTSVTDKDFVALKPKEASRKTAFIGLKKDAKAVVSPKRVELQKKVDAALLPLVKQVGKEFVDYLGSRFQLSKGQYPHVIKF